MCQSKFSNASATSMVSSFTEPTNLIYLNTATNSMTSAFLTQSTNSTRFSHTSPTISSSIKDKTENRQADIQDADIDMNLEEKSDDLMDLIAKFEKLEIMDEMDWEAIKARTDNHQADTFPQDIAIDMNLEEKSDDLMDLIAKFEKMELVDDMDWKAL